jgi:basic membrane protein A
MKRKSFAAWTVITLLSIASISSCNSYQTENNDVSVIHFINGAVGDKSFFDSAVSGIARAKEDFHLNVTTIEGGYDTTLWRQMIKDAATNMDYDIMIVGSTPMLELLEEVAQMHPDKKFIIYDSCVNYTNGNFENVYSILYRQNEGAYLAGVYAGLMTNTNKIGILGGQNSTTINDFVIGYEQGSRSVKPDIDVLVAYAESWNDSAKGESLATDMYKDGADIIFQAAGTTGLGVFQAALNSDKYAIGVDSDQALLMENTDPEQAKHIPTSMMKNVDQSLYRALGLYIDGQLPFGRAETLGIKEGAVGLAKSKYYQEITPEDVKSKINQTEIDIMDGKIKVETAFR